MHALLVAVRGPTPSSSSPGLAWRKVAVLRARGWGSWDGSAPDAAEIPDLQPGVELPPSSSGPGPAWRKVAQVQSTRLGQLCWQELICDLRRICSRTLQPLP